jgi:Zn-dependent protease with chaperone function
MNKNNEPVELPAWLMALSYVVPLTFFVLLLIYFTYTKANEYRAPNTSYDWSHATYDAYSQDLQKAQLQEKEYQESLTSNYDQSKQISSDQYRQFQKDQEIGKKQRELFKFSR